MPTNDYIFKKIFGSVGSEAITTSFLEAILESKITSIDLDKNPITDKNELDDYFKEVSDLVLYKQEQTEDKEEISEE